MFNNYDDAQCVGKIDNIVNAFYDKVSLPKNEGGCKLMNQPGQPIGITCAQKMIDALMLRWYNDDLPSIVTDNWGTPIEKRLDASSGNPDNYYCDCLGDKMQDQRDTQALHFFLFQDTAEEMYEAWDNCRKGASGVYNLIRCYVTPIALDLALMNLACSRDVANELKEKLSS